MRWFRRKCKSLAREKYDNKVVTAELDDDTTIYFDRPNEITVRRSKNGDDGYLNMLIISDIPTKTWSRLEKYLIRLAEGRGEIYREEKYLRAFITSNVTNRMKKHDN